MAAQGHQAGEGVQTCTTITTAWALLAQALGNKKPVRVRYHGQERVICPHALGWKSGRPRVLAYQAGGATSRGELPDDRRQRWRCLFVDEIEDPVVIDGPWQSADNYTPNPNGIDQLAIAINR